MGIIVDKAVSRWFTVDARGSAEWVRVRGMTAAGSIDGTEKLSGAVLESVGHNTKERDHKGQEILMHLGLPTLFLCGAGDGVFPEEMERYPGMMKKEKGRFALIARANRLVCCEEKRELVNLLQDWLTEFP